MCKPSNWTEIRIVTPIPQVSRYETEKATLQKEASNAGSKLLDAKVTICDLEEECVSTYALTCSSSIHPDLVMKYCLEYR